MSLTDKAMNSYDVALYKAVVQNSAQINSLLKLLVAKQVISIEDIKENVSEFIASVNSAVFEAESSNAESVAH